MLHCASWPIGLRACSHSVDQPIAPLRALSCPSCSATRLPAPMRHEPAMRGLTSGCLTLKLSLTLGSRSRAHGAGVGGWSRNMTEPQSGKAIAPGRKASTTTNTAETSIHENRQYCGNGGNHHEYPFSFRMGRDSICSPKGGQHDNQYCRP
ncbi:hypothetical protein D9M71_549020 [compost metagenome]